MPTISFLHENGEYRFFVGGKEWVPKYTPAPCRHRGNCCVELEQNCKPGDEEACGWYAPESKSTPAPDGADWDKVGVIASGQTLDGCTYPSDMMTVIARALLELRATVKIQRTMLHELSLVHGKAIDRLSALENKLDHITVTDE